MSDDLITEMTNEWAKDAIIDRTKILVEISRVPLLHSKYVNFYIKIRAKRSSIDKQLNSKKYLKRKYYRGECTQSDLLDNGWSQYQGLKPSMTELNQLFDLDPDLNEIKERLEYWNTALASIEFIIKAISSRGWELRTLVDYTKFLEGA